MPLVLYNSLTHREETFTPLDPEHVRLYVCGPTVYDRAHIGNARSVVVFDQLYRVLREVYGAGHVTYVRNITDVDDKIIDAARERGESIADLTARTTADFHDDMKALGALPPDIEPRATRYIAQMIALIERLIAGGHAYTAEGHVLFAVGTAADYGKLSRRSREEMIAGARVEVAPYKRDPGDFVLWKPSPPDLPGWDSPWGRGRPGWHIECSAMSEANLGESFDIHGGGLDLIFPHHENEIAQSEAAHHGHPPARVWMHNEMLTVDGVKMSKSLGNIRTVRELLDAAPDRIREGEAIRLALLSTHYRDPLDWTAEKLRQARLALDRFYRALTLPRDPVFERFGEAEAAMAPAREALLDDLNTPRALAALHELTGRINRTSSDAERSALQQALERGGRLMGLLAQNPLDWLRGSAGVMAGVGAAAPAADARHIEERIALRMAARRARRYAEADRIRVELAADGIILEDKPDGTTTWRRGA